ncbi:MAG: type II toxin-antitoxin system RelE/ParE family toxin, partial [Austwickia sp.]|nr:type II toxin-antitoxin system RelE/ParE family toxin [Austwickia sp.]
GYRLYFVRRGSTVILLLAGGDKSSQDDDIAMAKRLELQLRKEQQWP